MNNKFLAELLEAYKAKAETNVPQIFMIDAAKDYVWTQYNFYIRIVKEACSAGVITEDQESEHLSSLEKWRDDVIAQKIYGRFKR